MKIHNRLTPIAGALLCLGMGHAIPTFAGELIEFGDGYKFDWRLGTTYTLAQRMKSPDPILAADDAANDGDNNFKKHALTANRLGLLLDSTLSKGDTGFALSASTFYDDVYHRSNDNTGIANKPGPANQFTEEARRYHGGYSRLLDAYAYSAFDIGEGHRATVRVGKHTVAWGEALLFPGIALAQAPADGTKTGIPGTETKDQLLSEDQISIMYEVTPRLSLMAHAQYNWHPTIPAAPGSYMSTSDVVGPGGSCLQYFPGAASCPIGARIDDLTPKKNRQWGVGGRYRVTDATEVGLYYLDYQDRTPLPEIDLFAGPGPATLLGSYRIHYFDNIKLLGGSISTMLGSKTTVAGEISYKQGAPVLVDTASNLGQTLPTPTRADIMQANVNALVNIGRTVFSDAALLLAEMSYVEISNIQARQAPGAPAGFATSNRATWGKSGLAISATLTLTYPGVIQGWEFGIPLSYAQQLRGRTILGGVGGEGAKSYGIGATMTYHSNFQVALTYLGYPGGPVVDAKKDSRSLADRDSLSLVLKYNF